jgi:cytidine deaminase
VGAAVLGAQGEIVLGCNVESASYGLSCCAERVALFSATAQAVKPVRLAVACVDAPPDSPASSRTPCGACRQIILDLMGPDAEIEIDGVGLLTALELLPHGFVLPA